MIRLEQTENSGFGYRHRTWTRIGDAPRRLSVLQNQFDLAEFDLPEAEAVQKFRHWLWQEMQDRYNVVWRELRGMAQAHLRGEEVEILVPHGAAHGEVIVRALNWMLANVPLPEVPKVAGSEPAPCYEPILPDGVVTVESDIDRRHIVWITGRTQSRISEICGACEAFVPTFGVLPLRNFRWVSRRLAEHPTLQEWLSREIDRDVTAEAAQSPVEYEPYPAYNTADRYNQVDWGEEGMSDREDFGQLHYEGDLARQADLLIREAREASEEEEKAEDAQPETRPLPTFFATQTEHVRPVYKYRSENDPLRVKSAEEQVTGKRWRYAGKEDTESYRKVFRSSSAKKQI